MSRSATANVVIHDEKLERALAASLVLEPSYLDLADDSFGIDRVLDFQARATIAAVSNLRARDEVVDRDAVAAELERQGFADIRVWYPKLIDALVVVPPARLVSGWFSTVIRHDTQRREAVEAADQDLDLERFARMGLTVLDRDEPEVSPVAKSARVVTMSTVARELVVWLWFAWIARGMLNLIDGDPGVGKSTITLDLAARVTRGLPMPNAAISTCVAADVVLIASEDHLGATQLPRLEAAGADLARVHVIVAVPTPSDKDAPPTLADVAQIERVINEKKVALVVIDPLMAHLPSGTDAYRDSEMRALLGPWAQMAQRTGTAVVLVRHLRKMGGSALYRGGGTVGIVGAVRSAMLVGRDPENPDSCVLAHTKGNLAVPPKSLRYRVVDCNGIGRIEWLGVADGVTADRLAALPDQSVKEADPVDVAVVALEAVLSKGARPTKQVEAEVIAMTGASRRTIERARSKLGVVAHKQIDQSAKVAVWMLSLPGGGVEIEQDRPVDRDGGVVAADPYISLETKDSLHTATTEKSGGGLEGGGLVQIHNAATGSQTVWSPAVYSDARLRGLHVDDD